MLRISQRPSIAALLKISVMLASTFILVACSPEPAGDDAKNPATEPMKTATVAKQYRAVEWTDLLPKEDLDALLNPPEYLNDITDGSLEDSLSSQLQAIATADSDPYQQALRSTRIVDSFNGQAIRIPGFIVPLEFDEAENVTHFFLVPYFGACMHLPPPPPNQIIFGVVAQGFKLNSLTDAFWIEGTLRATQVENETALAAYAMDIDKIEIYTE